MARFAANMRNHAETAVVAEFFRIVEATRSRRERLMGRACQLGHVEDAHYFGYRQEMSDHYTPLGGSRSLQRL